MAERSTEETVNLYQPKKRFLIPINNFHVPRKLYKLFKHTKYTFRLNHNFEEVISQCQSSNRKDDGTWINDIILNSYINLYHNKMCHSIECYDDRTLIGGLYGVHIGGCFFGESMFSRETDGSKIALAYLHHRLEHTGFKLFDVQFITPHLTSLGAINITRSQYLDQLKQALTQKADFLDPQYRVSAYDVAQRRGQTS